MLGKMPSLTARQRRNLWLAGLIGSVLTLIGIRFLVVPHGASFTFGLGAVPANDTYPLHAVIGFRDIWLGLLAVALAVLREWRALALWLAGATLVCLADAVLVVSYGGPVAAIVFHLLSGLLCIALARAFLIHHRERQGP